MIVAWFSFIFFRKIAVTSNQSNSYWFSFVFSKIAVTFSKPVLNDPKTNIRINNVFVLLILLYTSSISPVLINVCRYNVVDFVRARLHPTSELFINNRVETEARDEVSAPYSPKFGPRWRYVMRSPARDWFVRRPKGVLLCMSRACRLYLCLIASFRMRNLPTVGHTFPVHTLFW